MHQQCGLECLPCERPWYYEPVHSATGCCLFLYFVFFSTKLLFMFTFTRSKPPVYLFARPDSISCCQSSLRFVHVHLSSSFPRWRWLLNRLHFIRRSTVGSRTFTASGAASWNDLPAHVTAASSLAVFRQRLKTFLFSRSYPDIVT